MRTTTAYIEHSRVVVMVVVWVRQGEADQANCSAVTALRVAQHVGGESIRKNSQLLTASQYEGKVNVKRKMSNGLENLEGLAGKPRCVKHLDFICSYPNINDVYHRDHIAIFTICSPKPGQIAAVCLY